jgi:hypothetical protein
MEEKLAFYLTLGMNTTPSKKINYLKNFFETALPTAYKRCIEECQAKVFIEPSPEQARLLGIRSAKKKPVQLVSQGSAPSIIKLTPKKDKVKKPSVNSSALGEKSVLKLEKPQVITPSQVEDKETANEDEVAIGADETTKVAPVEVGEETSIIQDDLKPVKALTGRRALDDSLFLPQKIEIEFVTDENIKKEMREYEMELEKYKEMASLPTSSPQDVMNSGQELKVTNTPSEKKQRFVASWSTGDFLSLFPAANSVYHENISMSTAELAAHGKNLKFQWIFDESIIIDQDTYIFLCQVFGLHSGSKELTFTNFLKTFLALTNGDTVGKKNRTVFKFRHCFDLGDCIGIPPIGGVHPEHLSSRFNHVQVRTFLEHGGAHPYFFKLLDQ